MGGLEISSLMHYDQVAVELPLKDEGLAKASWPNPN